MKRSASKTEVVGLHIWLLIVLIYAASCSQEALRGYSSPYPPTFQLPFVLSPVLILVTVLFFVYLPPPFRWLPLIGSIVLPYGPLVTLTWLGLSPLHIGLASQVYRFASSSDEIGLVVSLALAGATILQCLCYCFTKNASDTRVKAPEESDQL